VRSGLQPRKSGLSRCPGYVEAEMRPKADLHACHRRSLCEAGSRKYLCQHERAFEPRPLRCRVRCLQVGRRRCGVAAEAASCLQDPETPSQTQQLQRTSISAWDRECVSWRFSKHASQLPNGYSYSHLQAPPPVACAALGQASGLQGNHQGTARVEACNILRQDRDIRIRKSVLNWLVYL
jgi:hypothetical protein